MLSLWLIAFLLVLVLPGLAGPWLVPLVPLALAAPAPHGPAAAHATHGVHGMVLFGTERWYVSHLPLYRAPHDYQVLVEVAIADPEAAAAVAALRETGRLITIEPEPFELARLAPGSATPLTEFRAAIYDGHFERGGQRVRDSVMLTVQRVLVHRQLAPRMPRDKRPTYFVLGSGTDCWLVHRIGGRPDFDQILRVRSARQCQAKPATGKLRTVTLTGVNTPARRLTQGSRQSGIEVMHEIYFETADLAEPAAATTPGATPCSTAACP